MRILHAVHGFPPEHDGGTELYVARLAAAQAAAGHEVLIASGSYRDGYDGFVPQDSPGPGIRLWRITQRGHERERWDHGSSPWLEREFLRLLAEQQPDLVHVQHWVRLTRTLVRCASRAGLPVVVTLHDLYATCPRIVRVREDEAFCERPLGVTSCLDCVPRADWFGDELVAQQIESFARDMREELAQASAIVVPSAAHARAVARFAELDEQGIHVVAHASLSEGQPSPATWRAGCGRPLRVAHWGHLLPYKAPHVLLEAVRQLPAGEVELLLWGRCDDTAYGARLERLSEGVRVTRRERFGRADLAELRADLAVFPTLAHESHSFVLDEAFALGLPVLATARGALADRVGGAGATFPPGDAVALADHLRRILNEPGELDAMRAAVPVPRTFGEHWGDLERVYAGARPGAAVSPRGERLRVLFVVHQFLPEHVAGTEVYTYNLAKELQRAGHDVSVFTTEADGDAPTSALRGKAHDGLPVWEAVHNNTFPSFELMYEDREKEEQFRRVLAEAAPDLVHLQHLHKHSLGYVRIAKELGLPVVYTLHEFLLMCVHNGWLVRPGWELCSGPEVAECAKCAVGFPEPAGGASWEEAIAVRQRAVKEALDEVDLFISPSRFLRDRFIAAGMIAPERILYSDNGIPMSSYSRVEHRSSAQLRFGFVGTIAEWKGVHLIVEAMRGMPPDVACRIWGVLDYFPDYVERLKAAATHPGIEFLGRFTNDRVAEILADIDCLIVPSLWYENSPITIHEAFLAGVPVIAADQGGMAEYVDDGVNGLHFRMHDADDLRRQMLRVVENRELLAGLRGFPEFKDISDDAAEMADRYRALVSTGHSCTGNSGQARVSGAPRHGNTPPS